MPRTRPAVEARPASGERPRKESEPALTLRQRRSIETHRAIMAAAIPLFADQGFGSTTTDDVAAAAGVSKGLIFNNFESKAGLYESILNSIGDSIVDTIQTAQSGLDGFDALEAVAGALLHLVADNPAGAQLLMGELYRSDRPWQKSLEAIRSAITTPLAGVVRQTYLERLRAGAEGTPGQISAHHYETVAQAIIGAVLAAGLDHHLRDPEGSVDALSSTLMIAISGLRPRH